MYGALLDKGKSQLTEGHVFGLQRKSQVPQDVHLYAPWEDERADQQPRGMITVNEQVLEAGLRFPLHSAISPNQ